MNRSTREQLQVASSPPRHPLGATRIPGILKSGGADIPFPQSPLHGLFQLEELRSHLDTAVTPPGQAALQKQIDAKAAEARAKLQPFPALAGAIDFVITKTIPSSADPITDTWRQHIVPQFYLRGFRHDTNPKSKDARIFQFLKHSRSAGDCMINEVDF